jgi:hypothetical protein
VLVLIQTFIGGIGMLLFCIASGLLVLVGASYFAHRIIALSAQENEDSTKIANICDLNELNPLGKFGLGAL